jgi:amino acid adenylation domain-containing protein
MLSDSERAAMAARLRRGRTAAPAGITRREPGAEIPLSFGQEQLWFIDQIAPGHATYNVAGGFRLRGPLDEPALGRALAGVLARHEALRTRLVTTDGSPRQVVDEPAPVALPVTDVAADGMPAYLLAEAARTFVLAEGPLLRASLARLAPDEHVLLIVVHHVVFDGWSLGVLLREVAALYGAEVTGELSGLGDLPVQYGDYAIWERQRLQGSALDGLVEYWRGALEGVSNVQLPTDRPRPLLEDFEGAVVRRELDPALLGGLRELSHREGTTLFVTLLAAFQVLLQRHTGQDDLVVGTPSANRTRAELAPLIGYLVNTLPIRADCSGDPSFVQLLRQVRDTTVAAYAHQELPFAKLVEVLGVDRDPSRAPLTQILFLHAEEETAVLEAGGVAFSVDPAEADPGTAKVDLNFAVGTSADGIHALAQYATALFDRATMERLLGHYEVLLGGIVDDPTQHLSQLPLLTEAELYRELVEWNDTAREREVSCFHWRFERQAAATPDGVAAELDGTTVTYAELDRQANRIARRLHDLGVGPEVLAGISMAPSLRRLAVVLGILKAGGGYVPIDPDLPAERRAFMLADAAIPVAVCDAGAAVAMAGAGAGAGVTVVDVDASWESLAALDGSDPAFPVEPSNVAYVIYTSGSTGTPKGVVVEHRQALNVVEAMIALWSTGPGDRVLQFASLSFDVSVNDIFMPLLSGATAVVADRDTLRSPPRLADLIRNGVTFAGLPSAVMSLLTDEEFPDLRVLFQAGEDLPSEVARAFMRPGLRLCNGYGPTEACVYTAFAELDGSVYPPPFGRPLPNYQCYVLDPHLEPVPVGVAGELHIGGCAVARGYLNRPDLTAERFVPDPFRDEPDARLYKTGDLVRRLPDGQLQFIGRMDGQVKLHGMRIELGEVETVLASHPAVAQSLASVVEDRAGAKHLVGYVRLVAGSPAHDTVAGDVAGALREHAAAWLPSYMVPSHVVVMDAFPLTPNGKIDRKALPLPDAAGAASTYAPPTSLLETLVVDTYVGLLQLERVGIDDSFFDIGGNSLQAMRLIARLRDDLAIDLDVTALFLSPTPRQLAARIEATFGDPAHAPGPQGVVELAGSANDAPLFLVHAIGGTVHGYVPFARELAGTFDVYGIEASAGPSGPAGSVAEMAERYVGVVREVQPSGPYRLAGWSMGGLVAYEMARQIEAMGDGVALLALLDAPFAIPSEDALSEEELAAEFVADAARTAGLALDEVPDGAGAGAGDRLAWLAERLGGGEAIGSELEHRFGVFKANRSILGGHRPAGSVQAHSLVIGAGRSVNSVHQPHWPEVLAGDHKAVSLETDHYALLQHPHVSEVAALLLEVAAAAEPER